MPALDAKPTIKFTAKFSKKHVMIVIEDVIVKDMSHSATGKLCTDIIRFEPHGTGSGKERIWTFVEYNVPHY